MAGTREGGLKAAAKNTAKNPNFYAEIGGKGGRNGNTGGFKYLAQFQCSCSLLAYDHNLASHAGVKGGTISRRRSKKLVSDHIVTNGGGYDGQGVRRQARQTA